MSRVFMSSSLMLCAFLLGCSREAPPPMHSGAVPPPRVESALPEGDSIRIDEAIVAACGTIPTARFDFDSAQLKPDGERALEAVAACFTTGPLHHHRLSIVGHADPRGELEYNLALGQQRAGAVAAHLGRFGLDDARMSTLSRGELDASGTDEAGWALDRKVELVLKAQGRPDAIGWNPPPTE